MRAVWKHYRPIADDTIIIADNVSTGEIYDLLSDSVFIRGDIRCIHYVRSESDWTPANDGGLTVCYLYDDDGNLLMTGESECSVKDQFCYRIGREISYGRAMRALEKKLEKKRNDVIEEFVGTSSAAGFA